MFVFIVSVLLYFYLSVRLFVYLYITILSVLPEWRINFIINHFQDIFICLVPQPTGRVVHSISPGSPHRCITAIQHACTDSTRQYKPKQINTHTNEPKWVNPVSETKQNLAQTKPLSCSNDCATTESYTMLLLESSYGNIIIFLLLLTKSR